MGEIGQRFGQPTLIGNGFIAKQCIDEPHVLSRAGSYVQFPSFINLMIHTSKELSFFADAESTTNLKHATDKLPHTEANIGINLSSIGESIIQLWTFLTIGSKLLHERMED